MIILMFMLSIIVNVILLAMYSEQGNKLKILDIANRELTKIAYEDPSTKYKLGTILKEDHLNEYQNSKVYLVQIKDMTDLSISWVMCKNGYGEIRDEEIIFDLGEDLDNALSLWNEKIKLLKDPKLLKKQEEREMEIN